MASVTFTTPDDIKSEMKRLSWVNWSELARQETLSRIKEDEEIEEFRRIVSKSKMTQEQADKLADEASSALSKRYEKLLKESK